MVVRVVAIISGLTLGGLTLMLAYAAPGYTLSRATPGGIILLAVAGWTPMLAAVLLPGRRRGIAALLFLSGAAWFVAEWDSPGAPAVMFTIGLVGFAAAPVLVLHASMAYGGATSSSRILALTGYALTVGVLGFGGSLWFDPDPAVCGCAGNPFAIGDDPALAAQVNLIGIRAGLVWVVGILALLIYRLVTSSRALRRATGAVTGSGLVYAALTAGVYLNALDSGMLGSDEVDRRLWVGQAITLTALAVVVITGAFRVHLARRALAGIVTDLARGGGDLREDLAARLGDPALVIAYPVENGARYVDSRGQPVSIPDDGGAVATPVARNGVEVALLIHHADLDSARMESLASAVGLALEYERLNAEALAQLADLRHSGERIVAAGDTERRRLERDMHDGAQQQLVSLVLRGRLLQTRHPDDPGIATAVVSLAMAAEQLRMTARRLSSVLLDNAGLPAALAALAESRPLTIRSVPSARLPALVETTVYLLAERASRDAGVVISVTEVDGTVTAVLDCESEPDLADLVDRVTTLGGTLHQRTAETMRTIVTARWEGVTTA